MRTSSPQKPATISEVARKAGVAPSTVSRVLNGAPVTFQTRASVLRAVEELGFRPDPIARSLRSRVTRTIGFQVLDISNPIFAMIALGAEHALRTAGYTVLLSNSNADSYVEREQIATFLSKRVDGLILSVLDEHDEVLLRLLQSVRVPIVLLDRELPSTGAHVVISDHRSGARDAALYLADLGHTRIAYLGGATSLRPGRERLAGFLDGLSSRGVAVDEQLVRVGSLSTAFGSRELTALLELPRPPSALVAGGNQLGVGALEVIRRRGLQLPRDLSLIICDDIDAARLNAPPITVVARNPDQLGRSAAELLIEALTSDRPLDGMRVELGTELVVRGSCARLVASD